MGQQHEDRRVFRLLNVVDIYTRECLALEVATGFRARDVVGVLARIVAKRGAPIAIRCDQGTEFTAEALDRGRTTIALSSISRVQASRPTTHSLNRLTRASAKSC